MKEVTKIWGKEVWIVNDEYCGKFLYVKRGAWCSCHKHPIKKETFKVVEGTIELHLENEKFHLDSDSLPVTIEPDTFHRFCGVTDAIILEISTHHDDEDVVRLEESYAADKP